jgi:hypothetical protein
LFFARANSAIPTGYSRLASVFVVVVLLLTIAGCGGKADTISGHGNGEKLFPGLPSVSGHIDEVSANPENPRHFRILRITDNDGQRWEFESEGWVGVSAGHLKDHQIQGTTVTVWYEEQAGGLRMARFVSD